MDQNSFNEEKTNQDSKVDAISAVALIVIAVVIAVFWVSGQ
ncbi:hypothetical protein [Parendozoicomonas callyspongiae]|nr:hypothetical protein [Sansalvadorimonas sp. 2012CJ34-2]